MELGDICFTTDSVVAIPREVRRLLDRLAYRFAKLQDTLGERCLSGISSLTEEPLAPTAAFAEKLQRLERLWAISSAESWRELREIRNQIAHEYIDQPPMKGASLNRFRERHAAITGRMGGARAKVLQPGYAAREPGSHHEGMPRKDSARHPQLPAARTIGLAEAVSVAKTPLSPLPLWLAGALLQVLRPRNWRGRLHAISRPCAR